jgi:hypothetical protein
MPVTQWCALQQYPNDKAATTVSQNGKCSSSDIFFSDSSGVQLKHIFFVAARKYVIQVTALEQV